MLRCVFSFLLGVGTISEFGLAYLSTIIVIYNPRVNKVYLIKEIPINFFFPELYQKKKKKQKKNDIVNQKRNKRKII